MPVTALEIAHRSVVLEGRRFGAAGAPGDLRSMPGMTLPFPRPRAERAATDDPRPSIAERWDPRQRGL